MSLRKTVSFKVLDIERFKRSLQEWAQRSKELVWLDSNGHQYPYGSFDALLAVDSHSSMTTDYRNAFEKLSEYREKTRDWIFGYLSYDLKNDVEELESRNPDRLHFPDLHFFQPKKIIRIIGDRADFMYMDEVKDEVKDDFERISRWELEENQDPVGEGKVHLKMGIFKDTYFGKVQRLLEHIHRGDVYEANFCQEFYAEYTLIDPWQAYKKLNALSKVPFAAFVRFDDRYVISASPERYLKKMGSKVISQPIKGTAKRSSDRETDETLKKMLEEDPKERAENIMIVDLVRNDLSKSALKGSVEVEELCRVYSFEQVHQLVSTVSAQVSEDKDPVAIIKETFPMGSMTGAPKISAMKITEELEAFKRGLYSGAIGYFDPQGDFDFNVVIRSILYNATEKYVSFSVGGAITAKADPQREYEECLLKAKALRQVLENE